MKLIFRCFTVVGVTALLLGAQATAAHAERIQSAQDSSGQDETCSPAEEKHSPDGLRSGEFQLCVTRQTGNIFSYTVTVANLNEQALGVWGSKESGSLTIAISHLTRTSDVGDERRRDVRLGYGSSVQIGSGDSVVHRFVASPGHNALVANVSVVGVWSKPAGALRSGQLRVNLDVE